MGNISKTTALNFDTLNNGLTAFEEALNIINYLPYSGSSRTAPYRIRYKYGETLAIAGIAFTVFALGCAWALPGQQEAYHKWSKIGIEYAAHGLLNIARSYAEEQRWLFITIPYDVFNFHFLNYANVAANFHIQGRLFKYIQQEWVKLKVPELIPSLIHSLY